MKTQFIKLAFFLFSSLVFFSCLKDSTDESSISKANDSFQMSGLDDECPDLSDEACPSPCQSNCSALNNLFGASIGDMGDVDDVINCRNPEHEITTCELYCPTLKVRSGVNGVGWLYDSGCVSLFNNFLFPLCNTGSPSNSISVAEQEAIIDAAETLANNNIPVGCDYVIIGYDIFWVRITGDASCTINQVIFRIGVEVTYGPTSCAG